MPIYSKRTIISLLPEWEPVLDQLKKTQFYNDTKAEMFRYIIRLGLTVSKTETEEAESKEEELKNAGEHQLR